MEARLEAAQERAITISGASTHVKQREGYGCLPALSPSCPLQMRDRPPALRDARTWTGVPVSSTFITRGLAAVYSCSVRNVRLSAFLSLWPCTWAGGWAAGQAGMQ